MIVNTIMDSFWKAALAVGGVAAIGAFVLWSLYKDWLALPIFSKMTPEQTFQIMKMFLWFTFACFALSIASYAFMKKGGGDSVPSNGIKLNHPLRDQLEITFMSLKTMPNRLQEAADSGAVSFSFDETRKELEKTYSLACSYKNDNMEKLIDELRIRYNGYLDIIRKAINKDTTIDKVNTYHKEQIIDWYEENIRREYR